MTSLIQLEWCHTLVRKKPAKNDFEISLFWGSVCFCIALHQYIIICSWKWLMLETSNNFNNLLCAMLYLCSALHVHWYAIIFMPMTAGGRLCQRRCHTNINIRPAHWPFYLYNGNPHTRENSLYTESGLMVFCANKSYSETIFITIFPFTFDLKDILSIYLLSLKSVIILHMPRQYCVRIICKRI